MIHRRRLLMSGMKLDVAALEFSYTGTWTDTQIEMSGMTYRVLQLKSNGVLTIDPKMVGVLPFDVWCVRQGEEGEDGHGGSLVGGGAPYGSHLGCEQGGDTASDALLHYYASSGSNGANGGWLIKTGVIATSPSYSAVVTGSTSSLGNIIQVSNTSRAGAAWFSLPSSNNGAGGAGGEGEDYTECTYCGAVWEDPADSGSPGTPGIVVIRIPLGY